MLNSIGIGICGLGTVASGVVNVLQRNAAIIGQRAGCDVQIRHIGARRDNSGCDTSGYSVSRDIFDVVKNPDVQIVLELIGGTDVARQLVMDAIAAGKHVVTANKALIAEHGDEILAAAKASGVIVAFEAAVAGGIPVIKSLSEGLSANAVESIAGIINGTGNFILTEMREKNRSFAEALADAQALGYAEADPTFDVEGMDAAQKLVILSALAFGTPFDAEQCFTEGITQISIDDIAYADELGYRIKHLGIARKTGQGLEMRVHPTLVPEDQLLASVDGVMNAVSIKGDAVGPTLYYGAGAGSEPTASAVIADVIDIAKKIAGGQVAEAASIAGGSGQAEQLVVIPIGDVECAFYLRIHVSNQPGVLSEITQLLGHAGISVEALSQHEHRGTAAADEQVLVVLTTNTIKESVLRNAVEKIEGLQAVHRQVATIRIETME